MPINEDITLICTIKAKRLIFKCQSYIISPIVEKCLGNYQLQNINLSSYIIIHSSLQTVKEHAIGLVDMLSDTATCFQLTTLKQQHSFVHFSTIGDIMSYFNIQ
jgi:hypothetical protein